MAYRPQHHQSEGRQSMNERVYKFRAWIAEEGRFIYPTRIDFAGTVFYVYSGEDDYTFQINPEQLQQFSGYYTVDGEEIYVGDLLREDDYDSIYCCTFDEDHCGFRIDTSDEPYKYE